MTERLDFLKYYRYSLHKLSNSEKSKIKLYLIENGITVSQYSKDTIFGDVPLDKIPAQTFIEEAIKSSREAILLLQKLELINEHKYSIFLESSQEIEYNEVVKNEEFYENDRIEFLNEENNEIRSASIYNQNADYFIIKINFKLEKFDDFTNSTVFTRAVFTIVYHKENNVFEIRYNSLQSPFKLNQEYYLNFIFKIRTFLETKLKVKLDFLYLNHMFEKWNEIKEEYKMINKSSAFEDNGSAEMSTNEENQLPYIDEVRDIMLEFKNTFSEDPIKFPVFNEINMRIEELFTDKEAEARHNFITYTIKLRAEKFTFIHDRQLCIIHHLSKRIKSTADEEKRGSLDELSREIIRIKNKFC